MANFLDGYLYSVYNGLTNKKLHCTGVGENVVCPSICPDGVIEGLLNVPHWES